MATAVQMTYAIMYVSDMSRSVTFYRDALGLPLRFESPEWTEFATDGCTFALHPTHNENTPASAATMRAGGCIPGFRVTDLDAFHAHALNMGVKCFRQPEMVYGARIAHYAGPDNELVAVSEDGRA